MSANKFEITAAMKAARALYLNIGTVTEEKADIMRAAALLAGDKKIPIVLDPVGAGMSRFRLQLCRDLLGSGKVTAVRGNASEIMALSGLSEEMPGVDAVHEVEAARESAVMLARDCGTLVALTGRQDIVTDGCRQITISGGHSLMSKVAGMGCAVSALLAAYLTVSSLSPLEAACFCLEAAGRAGARAAAKAGGPGSFVPLWLDEIYSGEHWSNDPGADI
jgi:hydroxyethylthiazole kinase